jgi:hypothetical protein
VRHRDLKDDQLTKVCELTLPAVPAIAWIAMQVSEALPFLRGWF